MAFPQGDLGVFFCDDRVLFYGHDSPIRAKWLDCRNDSNHRKELIMSLSKLLEPSIQVVAEGWNCVNVEPLSPGWYPVMYGDIGGIDTRYYDERGWQSFPGEPTSFGMIDTDKWWNANLGKTLE